MQPTNIAIDQLLLDPNNYRLVEQEGYTPYAADRFHNDRVQQATRRRLGTENLEPLRNSIVSNGFLEIERIVVVPYAHDPDKYTVIEGNRRVAALLAIRDEIDAGVDIPQGLVDTMEAVPCLVANQEGQDPFFKEAIMGIRHVGGIREWGGYQRAKLVADMRDKHHLDASSISDRIGLSVVEVNRRYRAFKSLEQMQEDENYGEYAGPHMYPLFHEAVSLPVVREWLGWDADQCIFTDAEQREIFYQLISPRIPEVGPQIPPKLKSFSDIRALKDVLVNADAKNSLFQLDSELVDAIAIVTRDQITRRWRHEINEAKAALQNIPALEVEAFVEEDTAAIEDLINVANRILAAHRRAADI